MPITVTVDFNTILGAVIGISLASLVFAFIYKMAIGFNRSREYSRERDYGVNRDYARGRSYINNRLPRRRQNLGAYGLMMFTISSTIIVVMYNYNPDFDDGKEKHQKTYSDSTYQELGDIFLPTEEEQEPLSREDIIVEQLKSDSDYRFVSDQPASNETKATAFINEEEAIHFVQVAALPANALDDMEGILSSYQQRFKSFNVQLAQSTAGEAYPIKVLIGAFPSEDAARRVAKQLGKPYKHSVNDGLSLYNQTQRVIY